MKTKCPPHSMSYVLSAYRIFSIKRLGVYFLSRSAYPAFTRNGRLLDRDCRLFIVISRRFPQSIQLTPTPVNMNDCFQHYQNRHKHEELQDHHRVFAFL